MTRVLIQPSHLIAGLFVVWGLFIFSYLSYMLQAYPLFPFRMDSLDWTREWLYMTVLDYYGVAICLCAIAVSTEKYLLIGLLWSIGFCLLGMYIHPRYSRVPFPLSVFRGRVTRLLCLHSISTGDVPLVEPVPVRRGRREGSFAGVADWTHTYALYHMRIY
jgi:hypothetical protein